MNKFIAFIVSILLIFFPNSVSLIGAQQTLAFPGYDVIESNIVEAYNTGNYDLIIDLLSKEAKERLGNPKEKIEVFFSSIEGEEIISYEFGGWGFGMTEKHDDHIHERQTRYVKICTDTNTYEIGYTCIITDTQYPEKVGISGMTLYNWPNEYITELYD